MPRAGDFEVHCRSSDFVARQSQHAPCLAHLYVVACGGGTIKHPTQEGRVSSPKLRLNNHTSYGFGTYDSIIALQLDPLGYKGLSSEGSWQAPFQLQRLVSARHNVIGSANWSHIRRPIIRVQSRHCLHAWSCSSHYNYQDC